MTGDDGTLQQAMMLQHHHGGGADSSAPATKRGLLFEQIDGQRGITDHFAAGQTAGHHDGFKVTTGQLVEVSLLR